MEKSIILVSAGNRVTLAEYFIKNGWRVCHVDFLEEDADKTPIELKLDKEGLLHYRYHNNDFGIKTFIKDLSAMDKFYIMSCHDAVTSKLAFYLENHKYWVHGSYLSSKICYDKIMFEAMITQHSNRSCNDNQKIVIKDRFGCGSKGINIIERPDIGHYRSAASLESVMQPFYEGDEYTVDAYYDEYNLLTCFSCRIREKVVAGEVVKSRIVVNKRLHELCEKYGDYFSLKGPCTLQFIRDQLIEINDRVGGGITLSLEAGFDLSSLILKRGDQYPTVIDKPLRLTRCYRDFYE